MKEGSPLIAVGIERSRENRTNEAMKAFFSKKSKGMTLVEVVLAITILSVGLSVLLTGVSRCLAVMKASRRYQNALWALEKGMVDYPLFVTNDVKSLEVDGVEYEQFEFWREVEDDEDEDGLYVTRTGVTWHEGGRAMSEEVIQYVLEVDDEK